MGQHSYECFPTVHLLFLIVFVLVLTIGTATASGSPVEVWNRTYDGEGMQDEGFYVTAAPDGGYVITGYVTTDTGGEDCVLMKTDSSGNRVWQKDYGGTAADRGSMVLPTGSGYIMAGTTRSFRPDSNADAWLIMTSVNGTELWNRTYGGDEIEEALSMDSAAGGGFILAGQSSSFTDTHIPYLWLVRTDGDGNEIWNRTISTLYTSKGSDVISTSDGGYAITGTMGSTGNSNPLLVKTNSSGELEWIRWYDLGYTAGTTREGHALQQTADGGYIIAGTMGNFETGSLDGLLIKTDGDGNEEWNHTYGISGPMANDDAQDVILEGSGYIFTGYTTPPGSSSQFWLVNTDSGGLIAWNTSFGSVHDCVAHAILEPHPGEYVLLGTSGSDDEYTDIRLVKAGNPTAPSADFIGSPLSGFSPMTVLFDDNSTGNPSSWMWIFGDGTTSAGSIHVNHTYTNPGNYSVTLVASNSEGSDNETKPDYIHVYPYIPPPEPPVADFVAVPTEGYPPLTVTFNDTSTGGIPASWFWDFGDGTNSTLQNPVHTYTFLGHYTVNLTVKNSGGESTEIKKDYIYVFQPTMIPPPEANFTATPSSGTAPLTVVFNDTSLRATSWNWDFGDGNTSSLKDPAHTYVLPMNYTVVLTAYNMGGYSFKTGYVNVLPPHPLLDANFSADPVSGFAPLEVSFMDLTIGSPVSWRWDFGNGDNSTVQNPVYSYSNPGMYTISLTTWDLYRNDTETKPNFILVMPVTVSPTPTPLILAPHADFTGSPTSGSAPLLVTFVDLSTGPPTSWYWDFGDNSTTSTVQNPTHTFSQPGSYTIILRATNDLGNDLITRYGYINVSAPVQPPVADFLASPVSGPAPLSVAFSDISTGNPTAWNWSFGDGTYSSDQMVNHTYTNPGTYTVLLAVWNSAGVDNETKANYISVTEVSQGAGLTLENGWNFISIPFRLAQGHNTVSIFDGVDLAGHAIWTYDGFSKSWARMDAGSLLEPLDGIWIYSRGTTFVPLQYADDPVGTPPLKQLAKGWNAVGVSGPAAGTARDILLSVKEGWTQAIGFDEKTQAYETAVVNGGSGAFSDGRYLDPGQGCWLYMRAPGELAGMGV